MLTGYIRGQELRISTPEIAADSIKYLEAEFHFAGRDWDGYVKTAYFINGASKFALVLADDRITADMGLNLTAGEWEVKLSGVKDSSRITTTTEHIYVREFGSTEGTLPDVTPTQAEQLLAKIGDMSALETEAKDSLVAAINEAAQTGGGGTGDHSKLKNRDAADQHPMSAITGLASALEGKQPVGEYLSPDNLQSATDAALAQAKASGEFDGAKGDKGADGAAGADGITPHIGDNGNWYLGTTDTGKPSRGETGLQGPVGPVGPQGPQGEKGDADLTLGLTGATVGQIAKIAAVDASGVPVTWSPVDMPSGGSDLRWFEVVDITTEEQTQQLVISVDKDKRPISQYNALWMIFSIFFPADATQTSVNGTPWIYPFPKAGDHAYRSIVNVAAWKTTARTLTYAWAGLPRINYSSAMNSQLTFDADDDPDFLSGVYVHIQSAGDHIPAGTRVRIAVLSKGVTA